MKAKIKSNDVIVSAVQIHKTFKKNHVLKGVDFKIHKGEKISIVGENGAGKTTLVEILISLLKPDRGTGKISYGFSTKNAELGKVVGMQFQDSDYPAGIRVVDLYKFFTSLYSKEIDQKRLEKLKKIFDYEKIKKLEISKLSGGQKQRVNLLFSIIHLPELLILDEISTGLDIKTKKEIIEFVIEMQKKFNISIILISHNPEEIEALTDRVIQLKNGKIAKNITIKDIKTKYKTVNKFLLEVI